MFYLQLLLNPQEQYFISLWNEGWMIDMWSTLKFSTTKLNPAIIWSWNIIQSDTIKKNPSLSDVWPTHKTSDENVTFEEMWKDWRTADYMKCKWELHVGEFFQSFWYFLLLNVCSRPHHLFVLQIFPWPKVSALEIWGIGLLTHMQSQRAGEGWRGREGGQRDLLVFAVNKSWGHKAVLWLDFFIQKHLFSQQCIWKLGEPWKWGVIHCC